MNERRLQTLVYPDMGYAIGRRKLADHDRVIKFGRNDSIGSTVVPLCLGGNYRTPLPANSTKLQVVSTSAQDSEAGTGARSLYIQGLASDGTLQDEVVAMNGTTPVETVNTYWRVFRAYVAGSGTYATQTTGSTVGTITAVRTGTAEQWFEINDVSVFPKSQTQIGVYTVPKGHTALLTAVGIHIDATKPISMFLFQRRNTSFTPPYDAMRLVKEWDGLSESVHESYDFGIEFPELTDFGFMARAAVVGSAASVDFEIMLYTD